MANFIYESIIDEFGSIEDFNGAIQDVQETFVLNMSKEANVEAVQNALAILMSITRITRNAPIPTI